MGLWSKYNFYILKCSIIGHICLHLTCGSVQSIRINSLNTFFKVKGHGVNTYKIIICHMDWP